MALTKATNSLISGAPINILDYGADPTGVNDSTAAVQAALDAADSNGEVVIPKGDYKITSSLIIPNCTIRGENRKYSRLIYHADVPGAWVKGDNRIELYSLSMLVDSAVTNNYSGFINPPSLIDPATDAPTDPSTGQPYIGGARVHAENVEIAGFGKDGFRINNGNLSTFISCMGRDCGRNGMSIGGLNANAITVLNLQTANNGDNGFTTEALLDDGTSAGQSYNLNIYGGYGADNGDVGWEIGGNGFMVSGIGGESNTSGDQFRLLSNLTRSFVHHLGGAGFSLDNQTTAASNTIVSATLESDLRFKSGGLRMWDGTNESFKVRYSTPWVYLEALDSFRLTTGSSSFGDSGDLLEFLTGVFQPNPDNDITLGAASKRWSVIYAATGTINTSDAREKTFLTLADAEKAAALEIKANLRKFKFNDAIAAKGDGARIHFGASAQQVGEILTNHGLAPEEYAFYCYDEWEAEDAVFDADGNEIIPAKEAGNRYGLRYEELLSFIIMAT